MKKRGFILGNAALATLPVLQACSLAAKKTATKTAPMNLLKMFCLCTIQLNH